MRPFVLQMILGLLVLPLGRIRPGAGRAGRCGNTHGASRSRARSQGDRKVAARLRLLHRSFGLGQCGRPAHGRCRGRVRGVRCLCGQAFDPRAALFDRLRQARAAAAATARAHAAAAGDHALARRSHGPRPLACAGAARPVPGIRTLAGRSLRERVSQGERRLEDLAPALVRDLHRAVRWRLEGTDAGHQRGGPQDSAAGPTLHLHL